MSLFSYRIPFLTPNFVEMQRKSFINFMNTGLMYELSRKNPIYNSFTGFKLVFYPEHYRLSTPKYSPRTAILKFTTYSSKIYIPLQLTNYKSKSKHRTFHWIVLCNLPLMTKRGTFVVNGSPRIIVNQIVRSPGIHYKQIIDLNQNKTYYGDLISRRGAWLRFVIDKKKRVWIQMKKTRKIPILIFFKALGIPNMSLERSTKCFDFLNMSKKLTEKIETEDYSHPKTIEESLLWIYDFVYPEKKEDELPTVEKAQNFLFRKFFSHRTYDLGYSGRNQLNKKFNSNIDANIFVLTIKDLLFAVDYLIKFEQGIGVEDDIDHLKNRRVRTSGELLQNQIATGLIRLEKLIRENIQDSRFSTLNIFSRKPIDGALREFFGSSPLSQFMDETNPLAELTHKRRVSSLGPGGVTRETAGMQVRGIHPSHYGRICPIETPEGRNAGLVNSLTTLAQVTNQGVIKTPFHYVYQGQVQRYDSAPCFSSAQEQHIISAPSDLKTNYFNFLPSCLIPVRAGADFKKLITNKVQYMSVSPIQMISIATSLIPFLEHDDANRALMGSNMQRQAVPVLVPEPPIIGTGLEPRVVSDSGHGLQAKTSGIVTYTSNVNISVLNFYIKPFTLTTRNHLKYKYKISSINFNGFKDQVQDTTLTGLVKNQVQDITLNGLENSFSNIQNIWMRKISKIIEKKNNTVQPRHIFDMAQAAKISTHRTYCDFPGHVPFQFQLPGFFLKAPLPQQNRAQLKINSLAPAKHIAKKNITRVLSYKGIFQDSISKNILKQKKLCEKKSFSHPNSEYNIFAFYSLYVLKYHPIFLCDLIKPDIKSNKCKVYNAKKKLINSYKKTNSKQWIGFTSCLIFKNSKKNSLYDEFSDQAHDKKIILPGYWITKFFFSEAKNNNLSFCKLSAKVYRHKIQNISHITAQYFKSANLLNKATFTNSSFDPTLLTYKAVNNEIHATRLFLSTNTFYKNFFKFEKLLKSGAYKNTCHYFETFIANFTNECIQLSFSQIFIKKKNLKHTFLFSTLNWQNFNSENFAKCRFFQKTKSSNFFKIHNFHTVNPMLQSDTYKVQPPIKNRNVKITRYKNILPIHLLQKPISKTYYNKNILKNYSIIPVGYKQNIANEKVDTLLRFCIKPEQSVSRWSVESENSIKKIIQKPSFKTTAFFYRQPTQQKNNFTNLLSYKTNFQPSISVPTILYQPVDRIDTPPIPNFYNQLSSNQEKVLPQNTENISNNKNSIKAILRRNTISNLQLNLQFCHTITNHEVLPYQHSNQNTCMHQTSLVEAGEWIQKGDLLADSAASIGGELALGRSILVAYMPWEGYNFEDAILVSERLVYDDVYTSVHIEKYKIALSDNLQGLEYFTPEILGITEKERFNLTDQGIIKVGSWVTENDILVGKEEPLSERQKSGYKKLVYDVMEVERPRMLDTSLRVPKNVSGRIVHVELLKNENLSLENTRPGPSRVHVYIAEKRQLQIGDKMSGRHGNKGIISNILPQQDMPYLADGTPVDIVLNPLGVPSRMNVGQIFECLLGLAAKELNEHFRISCFDEMTGPQASKSFTYSKLIEAKIKTQKHWLFNPNFPGKMQLFDGRSGECFHQKVTVGQSYMLKLVHLVDEKIHARATGPYSLVTQQPVRGRSKHGGQRLGEMEVWALEGFGAAYTLQELLTTKSDDMKARREVMDAIIKNKLVSLGTPESLRLLLSELQSLCLNIGVYSINNSGYREKTEDNLHLS